MDLSGCYFEYNGITSRKYGLIFANVKTEQFLKLGGDIQQNTIFNKNSKRNIIIGESFKDSPIKFSAEIIADNDRTINHFERRKIEKWLFHCRDYNKLYVDLECDTYGETFEIINGVQKRLYLNCRFINAEKIEGNGGLAGYRFSVECDSCMAWQDPIVCEYEIENTSSVSSSTISVNVDTDLRDYIYPKVTILTGSIGGDIQIINNSDSSTRATSFVSLSPNTTITMNGDGINYISGDHFMKFNNKNFIRLLDGENTLFITGNIRKITFEYQNRRYL